MQNFWGQIRCTEEKVQMANTGSWIPQPRFLLQENLASRPFFTALSNPVSI